MRKQIFVKKELFKEVLKKLRIVRSIPFDGGYTNIPVQPVSFPLCEGWRPLPSAVSENTDAKWVATFIDDKISIICVTLPAGEICKKQVHDDANEHIHLNRGCLRDEVTGFVFHTGENYYIEAGVVHQLVALEESIYTATYIYQG